MVQSGYGAVTTGSTDPSGLQPRGAVQSNVLIRVFIFFAGLCFGVIFSVTFFSVPETPRTYYQHVKSRYGGNLIDEQVNVHEMVRLTHSQNESFHKDEDLEAQELKAKVRVLCVVLTSKETYKKAASAVNATWAPRCNSILYVSNFQDSELPVLKLQNTARVQGWGLMKQLLSHIYKQGYLDTHDWVLRTDDNTFVMLENLRRLLTPYSPSEAYYLGCRLKRQALPSGFMSAAAGYVLSREAVRRFVTDGIQQNLCNEKDVGEEEIEMGKCLDKLNVTSLDSRDSLGRGRFFPLAPDFHLIPGLVTPPGWSWDYLYYPSKQGFECCSDAAVSFHGIGQNKMYALNYLIYHLRPYGIASHST